MTASVEILTGVAGSGKTRRLLVEYRRALRAALEQSRPGGALWLTPTNASRRLVLDLLPDETLAACFAPNVLTFENFADRILAASSQNISRLTNIAKRTLLRRIIDSYNQSGELPHFSAIAQTSGFLDLVIAFISELKRDEIWPEQFTSACESRGADQKDRELAGIYAEYQDRLHALSLYDSEGRFWSARTILQSDYRGQFDQLSLVVVDGFTDFTHTQYEILEHLAGSAGRMLVSLPLETPLNRADLFAKSAAAFGRIEQWKANGHKVEFTECIDRDQPTLPAVDFASAHLFANPRELPQRSSGDGITILACTGQFGEVEVLAQRVKRLLLNGVPAEQIVVAFRSLDDYADLVNEVFSGAGIPFFCEAQIPLARAPVLKALVAVLQLELEDWSFERLMAVLDSNYFQPAWEEWRQGHAARAVAAQLRRWKLHSQRSAILKTLARCARREMENAESDDGDQTPSEAAIASAFLSRLADSTQRLNRPMDASHWVETLVSLAKELGITPRRTDRPEGDEAGALFDRDLRTWDVFEGILFEAVKFYRLWAGLPTRTQMRPQVSTSDGTRWGGRETAPQHRETAPQHRETAPQQGIDSPTEKVTLADFAVWLADLLNTQTVSPAANPNGCVRVADAVQVRNLEVPHLFLAGLSEMSFPQSRADDCLYGEAERRQLNEHGLSLKHSSSHSQDEMLLFYGVVTRARETLTLSYPSVSSSGAPLFASPYLTALRDLFDPETVREEQLDDLDPVPPPERVLTTADFRQFATAELRKSRPEFFRALFETAATREVAQNILAGIDMAVSRFSTHGFTNYEGLLKPTHVKALEKRFPADHQYSATQLEAYASCPFRFLLSEILKLKPLESPETATDYLGRGLLVHEVLSRLHGEDGPSPDASPTASPTALTDRFRELVDELMQRRIDDSELQQALTKVEAKLLHEWADAYEKQSNEYLSAFEGLWDSIPRPLHLETSFGDVPGDNPDETEPKFASLTFGADGNETRVRGRIDRVDVGEVDQRPAFVVVDYKTGKPPRFSEEDVQSGRAIQLALYTLAVRRLELLGPDAVPYQMGYWSLKEAGFVQGLKGRGTQKLKPIDEVVLESLEVMLEELIPRLAAGMRAGRFPVQSQNSECTSYCPYNTVCRVNQIRPLEETLEKRMEI